MEAELVADYACHTGENPLWHPDEKRLYWTDIPTGRLFRLEPDTGRHEQFYEGEVVGGFTFQRDGSLLLFGERGSVRSWREGRVRTLIEELPDERDTRFNDVSADPEGRVFCGTMPGKDHHARLYRLDPDGTVKTVLDDIGLSNGLGFSPDRSLLYYTDTGNQVIYVFDYDAETGSALNQRVFARVSRDTGSPDGLVVDAEGGIWSAHWGGGCIVRYTAEGELERQIEIPTAKVTSMAFGGAALNELFVTTAGGDDRGENGEGAGALYRVRPGVCGQREYFSRIRVG
jgi:D-xylono/L-arabinono-1,4-lactonase